MKEEEGRNLERGSDGGTGQLIAQQSQHLLTPGNQSETPVYLHPWVCTPLYQPPSITYHPSPDLELPLPLGTHSISSLEKRATVFPKRWRRCTHYTWASPLIFQQPPVTCDEEMPVLPLPVLAIASSSTHWRPTIYLHIFPIRFRPRATLPVHGCPWHTMLNFQCISTRSNHVLDIDGWFPAPSQCLGLNVASSSFYLHMSILST